MRGELYHLSLNYYEIFNLPVEFNVDLKSLHERYGEIQKSIHPDRFAAATKLEQQHSLVKSTQVNEAYQTLKNNLLRAKYLIELNYKNDPLPLSSDFLMQQMEWEEELEEIKEIEPLIVFKENIKMNVQKETLKLSKLLDQDRNWEDAQISLGELKFLSNLLTKTTELSHTLSDN